MDPDQGDDAGDAGQLSVHPSVLLLLGTLLLTAGATGMLCAAIMTDHWEHVTWNQTRLQHIAKTAPRVFSYNSYPRKEFQIALEWYLDDYVTRIAIRDPVKRHRNPDQLTAGDVASVFLVPMHGGIWTLCVSLTVEQVQLLSRVGFSQKECINYLAPSVDTRPELDIRPDWQHRMQNLSISCALVCLIILGCSALVGAFGVLKHQISAVLVTGVMYLLAATFALFTLTIVHFKRQQGRTRTSSITVDPECSDPSAVPGAFADGVSPSKDVFMGQQYAQTWEHYYSARDFSLGWSVDLGWGGVVLCVLASVLWILLSKIMRYPRTANTASLLS